LVIFVQAWTTLWLSHCLVNRHYRGFVLLRDIVLASGIAAAGLYIQDTIWLLVLAGAIIFSLVSHRFETVNYIPLTALIIACMVQIDFGFIATYLSRLILLIRTHSFNLHTAMQYSHPLIIIIAVAEIGVTLILVTLVRHYWQFLNRLTTLITDLQVEKQIFFMTLGIFVALETVLIISELLAIAAIIQGVLIVTFSLITILIVYQMVIFVRAYAARQKATAMSHQNQQLEGYMTSIEQQYTEFRRFKHDYNNLLLSLETMINSDDSQQLRAYYQELRQQSIVTQQNNAQMIVAADQITNEPVRGLLIQKYFRARNAGVTLTIEVMGHHLTIPNHVVPIVRILGILLDNAIEHVTATDSHQHVTCAFIDHPHSIEIIVENPASADLDIECLLTLGATTKGVHHGIGLANVQDLVYQLPNLYFNTALDHDNLQMSLVITKED
jgi:two-component system sensor histidine kinase AgrC